jgi:hypothetical protein
MNEPLNAQILMTLIPVSDTSFSAFQMSSFDSNVGNQYKLVPTNLSELRCDVFAHHLLIKGINYTFH